MRAAMASNLAANALVRQKKVDPGTEVPVIERKGSVHEVYNPKNALNGVESEEAE
jgi:hypothetical protein